MTVVKLESKLPKKLYLRDTALFNRVGKRAEVKRPPMKRRNLDVVGKVGICAALSCHVISSRGMPGCQDVGKVINQ